MLFWDHYTFWVPEQKDVAAAGLHGWHTFPKYFWLDFCMAAACVYHIVLSHINSVFLALFFRLLFLKNVINLCVSYIQFSSSEEGYRGGGKQGGSKRAKDPPIFWTIENKWVCYKHTIKVQISCSRRCPGTAAPSMPERMVSSFYLYSPGGLGPLKAGRCLRSKSLSRVRDWNKGVTVRKGSEWCSQMGAHRID